MNFRSISLLFLFQIVGLVLYSQPASFSVTKAGISSERYDEICPVYYKGGIVFCTNNSITGAARYSGSDGKGFFKILYSTDPLNDSWREPKLFSKELATRLNDGPISFSSDGNSAYFSRNLLTEGSVNEISGPRNKLGIYYSRKENEKWSDQRELRINSEWYNITSPCISPDGSRLYFASDKPGGYGGFDLYYCISENGYWGEPVNMGPAVNTPGNEVYPFVCVDGELFFSSDGLPGLGAKDIFFTRCVDSVWLEPVHLNEPVNSRYDDLGMVTDQAMEKGFFSSNRDGTYDIFYFTTLVPQFFYTPEQKANQYCYSFIDVDTVDFDRASMQYIWDFGDSGSSVGASASHCFPGPGQYSVQHYIVDRSTNKKIFISQIFDLELQRIQQPVISSADFAIRGEPLSFSGLDSYLPGFEIIKYFWDFGDGNFSNASNINHAFDIPGVYKITLGLTIKNLSTGALSLMSVYKNVTVFGSTIERNASTRPEEQFSKLSDNSNLKIVSKFIAKEELAKKSLYNVEIVRSISRLSLSDNRFGLLASKFQVKEVVLPEGGYSYIVASETNLKDAYKSWRTVYNLGYHGAIVRLVQVTDPAEKEMFNLKAVYGNNAEEFFLKNESRMTSTGFAFLDQVISLLNRYPDKNIIIESHYSKSTNSKINLQVSEQRAKSIADYFINRGINFRRIVFAGYGDARSLSSDLSEGELKKNNRIDIMLFE